ncbi:DUF1702 family protein [Saccharothrix syringae]|uniref:DUF1702 family protein n=1 Tax=Saccharothrix syringae TaxID=103733 RepID=UPI00068FB9C1|nr:DUF1702 family protein [Saccharothrix syringae]
MGEPFALPGAAAAVGRLLGLVRLPPSLADFGRRGFRTDRPHARAVLEAHARSFLVGFDTGARAWRDPHAALAEVDPEERGFAYEGAGMFARALDLATAGRARALRRLLAGPGDGYAHLVHVGAGWPLASARLRLPTPPPPTPLLRWLALDGAGFAETFFGGARALARRCRTAPGPEAEAVLAGCGRAVWFLQSADADGVAGLVAALPAPARPALWSGVGLACAYAGAADDACRARLVAAAGPHRAHLAQGVAFAAGARVRSGIVPAHTRAACEQVLGVAPERASAWTEVAARGLTGSADVHAYQAWRARLRELVAPVAPH